MKCPEIRDYRDCMFDTDRSEVEGSPTFPAGIRLDKRVQKPREIFYTSQRAETDSKTPTYQNASARQVPPKKEPFLPRNKRDNMPVPTMAQPQRPKSKRYK